MGKDGRSPCGRQGQHDYFLGVAKPILGARTGRGVGRDSGRVLQGTRAASPVGVGGSDEGLPCATQVEQGILIPDHQRDVCQIEIRSTMFRVTRR